MSIYDTTYTNNLDIRTRSTKTDSLLVWNQLTQQYERIVPGGGGPVVDLPYYLASDSIQFDDVSAVDKIFVQDVDHIKDVVLPAHESALEELDERVDANTSGVNNLMPRMTAVETTNATQTTNITNLQTKTANIVQTASTSLALGYTSTSATPRLLINSGGLFVSNGTTNNATYPHVKLTTNSITIAESSTGSVFLDVTRIDNIAKLTSVTTSDFNDKLNLTKGVTFPGAVESTDLSTKKMIVMDSTTKALSYATIPTGGDTNRQALYFKIISPRNFRHIVYDIKWTFQDLADNMMSSVFAFTNELMLDFVDRPFTIENLYYQAGKHYALFMDTLTMNDAVSMQYYPHVDDNMTGVTMRAALTEIPFNTLTKVFIRVEIRLPDAAALTRSFKGKLKISTFKTSTASSGAPITEIGPTG